MIKLIPLSALLLTLTCGTSSAAVFLLLPTSTTGTGSFDDSTSGGFSETLTAPTITPNSGIWRTMNYPGFLTYASGGPHVDSASLTVDITQAAGVPFFQATGALTQAASSLSDVATLTFQFASYFEGSMTGTPVLPATALMGLNVSGTVGTLAGEYVDFQMKEFYFDNLNNPIGDLTWTYNNSTPGATFSTTVFPVWSGSPILTDNLITVNGFVTVSADPSSISFAPAIVPEPTVSVCLLAGAASLALRRRRRD